MPFNLWKEHAFLATAEYAPKGDAAQNHKDSQSFTKNVAFQGKWFYQKHLLISNYLGRCRFIMQLDVQMYLYVGVPQA